ncbi:MAG: hypothetical protein SFU99_06150 [Saprospiraceae bacterium]|nr:hypothetical protein [Saprospiraceae bacterium]
MATLRQPAFIVIAIVFAIHQLLQKILHINLPWLDHYLDPLLCMPILLTLVLAERRHLFYKGNNYQLSLKGIIIAIVILSVLFEIVFPKLTSKFTADWGDAAVYVIGGLFFYLKLNRPL